MIYTETSTTYTWMTPLRTEETKEIAEALRMEPWVSIGAPVRLISRLGTNKTNQLICKATTTRNTHNNRGMAQVETFLKRLQEDINSAVASVAKADPTDWGRWMTHIHSALTTTTNIGTSRAAPAMLTYGFQPEHAWPRNTEEQRRLGVDRITKQLIQDRRQSMYLAHITNNNKGQQKTGGEFHEGGHSTNTTKQLRQQTKPVVTILNHR